MTTRLEPVAWRRRRDENQRWTVMDCAINAAEYVALGYEVQPLYAAAPAPDVMREAIAVAVGHELNAAGKGDATGCLTYSITDAILAIIAKGEGR